ncbi:hypothetical protein FRC17_011066 [Serendipita sp. 399]|nr:hypothetical protein FRC17_011066 [Serendipita sp. 399]
MMEHQPLPRLVFCVVCAKDQNFKPVEVKVEVGDSAVALGKKIVAEDEFRFRKLEIGASSLETFKAEIPADDIHFSKGAALDMLESAINADPLPASTKVYAELPTNPDDRTVYFIAKSRDFSDLLPFSSFHNFRRFLSKFSVVFEPSSSYPLRAVLNHDKLIRPEPLVPSNPLFKFLTFKLTSQSHYQSLSDGVLTINYIYINDTLQSLVDFQSKLEIKRVIQQESEFVNYHLKTAIITNDQSQVTTLRQLLGPQKFARHFQSQIAIDQAIIDPLDLVGDAEAETYAHLQQADHVYDIAPYVTGNKKAHLGALLWPLVGHKFQSGDPLFSFRSPWKFPLVAEITDSTERYRVDPVGDARLQVGALPYMILEVASKNTETGRYRMLLQASCLAKLGTHLSTDKSRPFIVTAIYIDDRMQASRYLMCKDSASRKVCYSMKRFNLTTKSGVFDFVFELFNLAGRIKEQSNYTSILDADAVTKQIKDLGLSSIHSKSSNWRAQGSLEGLTEQTQVIGDRMNEMDEAIGNAGYSLIIENDTDELRSLPILPESMRKAKAIDGSRVIAKYVKDKSDEVEILKHLHSLKGVEHHIIALLNVIPLTVGSLIIIPYYLPLPLTMSNLSTSDPVVSVQEQLIEGVRFMHQHGVAHRDLKPDNLVVKLEKKPVAFIIDFDLAIRVEGIETMIKGRCGTRGWMAPEMLAREGYNPILADLWSCGKMIAFIGLYMRLTPKMEELSRRLMDRNPSSRPLLHMSPLPGV